MTEIREYPKMKDIYGSLVFDQREMKQRLPLSSLTRGR